MDTYQLKWTKLQAQIIRVLCVKAGQSLNLRGIARILKVSPTAVSNALVGLEKETLISIQRSNLMNLLSIKFNRDNPKAIHFKRTENLRMIYESGLYEFLFNEFPGCAIILFGSYSRGEDTLSINDQEHNSDIDIAVIGTKGKNVDLLKFNKLLEREVIINFYASWKDIHKHLKESILSGILLSGAIEI